QKALPVIVAPVEENKNFSDKIEALGTTKANETVDVTANVTEIVNKIHFKDGQAIKKGDILVTLEKSEEEASLKSATALLDERTASYKRAKSLEKKQALSTATLEEREALLRQIEGDIEAIKARISDRVVKAPFDGVLGLRNISPGALVRPGDLITTIDDLSNIKVDFEVPSVFLQTLKTGLPIEGYIEAFDNQLFKGTVDTVGTQIDPVTRTVTVRAILPNKDEIIKPGLLIHIKLLRNQRVALLVPEESIIQKEKNFFVYKVVQQEGKTIAVQQEIKQGYRSHDMIEVISGLSPDDQVIVHGLMQVQSGQEINISAVEKGNKTLQEMLTESQSTAKGVSE
ncbi:MAG: efflux RND transporter periplasmic adaptor subunit, partial [Rickettsiales bacterium]